MKILIITVSAGYGHHSVAKSLSGYFGDDDEVTIIDLFKMTNNTIKLIIEKGYSVLSNNMNGVYRIIYNTALNNSSNKESNMFKLIKFISSVNEPKILGKIKEVNPNIIFCTHVFAALAINKLKEEKKITVPTYGIVTDFTIHPFWEQVNKLEYIVMDNEHMKSEALGRGISKNQILFHEIPINSKFYKPYSKEVARNILKVNPNKKTILIMGGGIGCVNYYKYVQQLVSLPDSYQLLVICGNNKKQYNKTKELKNKIINKQNLHLYGFVDNVEVFMSASDCIITKPGGLTVSEAKSKKLPLFLIDPIAGQEERNMEFLVTNKMGIGISKKYPINELIEEYFKK